jgi:hypothetical protein
MLGRMSMLSDGMTIDCWQQKANSSRKLSQSFQPALERIFEPINKVVPLPKRFLVHTEESS